MRPLCALLLPLLLSVALSGCHSGQVQAGQPAKPPSSGPESSFTVVLEESDAGSLGRPLEAAIRDYQAAHPEVLITVEQLINSYPSPGATEQELATLAERRAAQTSRLRAEVMSGGGPDLFLLHTSYIWADNLLPDVNKAVRAGTFADLTPLLDRDKTFCPQDFYTPLLDAGKVGGRQYVLPLSFTMPMFLATQKGLDSVGFDLMAAQTSMDAFLSEAARCLPEEQWSSMTLIEYAAALKQPLLDYDTHHVAFDTPAVRMAFSYQYAFSNPAWQPDPTVDYVPTMSLSPAREGDADRVQKLAAGELKLFGCPLFFGGLHSGPRGAATGAGGIAGVPAAPQRGGRRDRHRGQLRRHPCGQPQR